MDATALRASTHAVTPALAATTATTTNGPSSIVPTIGGGPTPAPAQPTLLGVKLLPAPAGQPQTIHLADGSLLVPLARVQTVQGSAPQPARAATAPASASTSTPVPAVAAAEPASTPAAPAAVAGGGGAFTPKGFLYNDRYFAKFHDASPIDFSDVEEVERRATKATMSYLVEEEPNVDDYGVTDVEIRQVDQVADRDLLTVNPHAKLVIDVHGVQGTGEAKSIPSVMNDDGSVFVDPRIGRT
jgi:hypothetical protein